tara:strand:- start:20728 stop:20862 length:135 start_codon:yes stop_codon:yes gene_type:complete
MMAFGKSSLSLNSVSFFYLHIEKKEYLKEKNYSTPKKKKRLKIN